MHAGIGTANVEVFEKDFINFLLEQYELYRKQHNEDNDQNCRKMACLRNN